MRTFRQNFEDAAPNLLSIAWDYAKNSLDVDLFWVYISTETGIIITNIFYQVSKSYFTPEDLTKALPEVDCSNRALTAVYQQLSRSAAEMYIGTIDKNEVPTRMILAYRPHDQDFRADFHYGPLQPGIPVDDQLFDSDVADAWFARLKETGNDSAAP